MALSASHRLGRSTTMRRWGEVRELLVSATRALLWAAAAWMAPDIVSWVDGDRRDAR